MGGACRLNEQSIHLWRIGVRSRCGDWSLLADAERARAARLVCRRKRDQFVATRAAMRRVLSRYIGIEPKAIEFAYGLHGKPSLGNAPELSFSLSHSGTVALLGVARETRLGVDVERIRSVRNVEGIGRRYFSAAEYDFLMALPASKRVRAFHQIWVCKEAYLKAWGTGMRFPLDRLSINLYAENAARLLATEMPMDRPRDWNFAFVDAAPDCTAAIAWHGNPDAGVLFRREGDNGSLYE